jgi:hypothetical protein
MRRRPPVANCEYSTHCGNQQAEVLGVSGDDLVLGTEVEALVAYLTSLE